MIDPGWCVFAAGALGGAAVAIIGAKSGSPRLCALGGTIAVAGWLIGAVLL